MSPPGTPLGLAAHLVKIFYPPARNSFGRKLAVEQVDENFFRIKLDGYDVGSFVCRVVVLQSRMIHPTKRIGASG